MGQDKGDKPIGKIDAPRKFSGLGGMIYRAKWTAVLTLGAAIAAYSVAHTKKYEDAEKFVPGVGFVPKDLYDKGIKDLDPRLASAITSIYLLSQNYEQHRLITQSDVPLDIAMRVVWGGAKVGSVDANRRIYHKDNIWRTPEESRAVFAEKIREALSRIDYKGYHALNDELKAVVDHGKAIVADAGGSLESKVVRYRPDTHPRGYRSPQ